MIEVEDLSRVLGEWLDGTPIKMGEMYFEYSEEEEYDRIRHVKSRTYLQAPITTFYTLAYPVYGGTDIKIGIAIWNPPPCKVTKNPYPVYRIDFRWPEDICVDNSERLWNEVRRIQKVKEDAGREERLKCVLHELRILIETHTDVRELNRLYFCSTLDLPRPRWQR